MDASGVLGAAEKAGRGGGHSGCGAVAARAAPRVRHAPAESWRDLRVVHCCLGQADIAPHDDLHARGARATEAPARATSSAWLNSSPRVQSRASCPREHDHDSPRRRFAFRPAPDAALAVAAALADAGRRRPWGIAPGAHPVPLHLCGIANRARWRTVPRDAVVHALRLYRALSREGLLVTREVLGGRPS